MSVWGWLGAALAGCITGVLSGFGIGGGTLLLIWLTTVMGVEQRTAQGINLLYFLPTSGAALPSHVKNGFVEKAALLPAILCGVCATALTAWIANGLEMGLLRKAFGVFLLYAGGSMLFQKKKEKKQAAE